MKLGVYHEMVFYPENLLIQKLLEEQAAGAKRFAWLGEMIMAAFESAATGRAVRIPMDTASPVYREGVVGIKQFESELPSDSILRKKRLYGLGPV